MQFNSAPEKFNIPFADAGDKVAIPQASQIGVKDGAASLTDGFPPLTRTRIDQGGIPPNGKEMNGILNGITLATRWTQAGGGNVYDSAFATAIGGYPKGARVLSSDGTKYWRARSDAITSDPEALNSATAGWVPDTITGYLTVQIAGDAVLTPAQYSNSHLLFTGATGSTTVITFPALAGVMWFVENQTNDEILAKTPTGQGVNISAGGRIDVYCDGPNLKSSVVTKSEDPSLANSTARPASTDWSARKFLAKTGGTLTGNLNGTTLSLSGSLSGVGANFSSDISAFNITGTNAVFAPLPAWGETGQKCVNLDYIRNPAHLVRFDTTDVSVIGWTSIPSLASSKINGAVFLVLFGGGNTALSSVVSYRTSVAQKGSVSVDDATKKMAYAHCDENGFVGYSVNPDLTGAATVPIQAIIRIH